MRTPYLHRTPDPMLTYEKRIVRSMPAMTHAHAHLVTTALALLCGHVGSLKAQLNYPPPTGVYCSCGPTTGVGQGSVATSIAQKPFVKGILVRVGWQHLEPSEDNYNWSLIDGQIAAANTYGKKISLGLGSGPSTPSWVYAAGAQSLQAISPPADTLPVPWDPVFLAKWTDLVADVGAHYANDTTIRLVYITNSSTNGFEMQLPFASTPSLSALGYSDAVHTNSWKTVVNAFGTAFPNHYLTNDHHPVNGSDAVADSVYAHASTVLGGRYGASAWWWTQNNTTVYPAQYDILQTSAMNDPFSGVQFAHSGTTDSAAFGPGGMPAALQLAIDNGVCYWEVWNQDILNADLETLLTDADCAAQVDVNLKVLLEGPWNAGVQLMNDDLRAMGLLPMIEPYTALGFPALDGGGETTTTAVLGLTGVNAIVDWVRVELRPAATPGTVIAAVQALLQRDGDVVAMDGVSPVSFTIAPGDHYIAVRHRNHLAMMTAVPMVFSEGSPVVVDFTLATTSTWGTNARKTIGPRMLAWAGNAYIDATPADVLKYTGVNNDRDPILARIGGVVPTGTATGYFLEDVNLNGTVKYTGSANDRDPILGNIGGVVPTAMRTEQLP